MWRVRELNGTFFIVLFGTYYLYLDETILEAVLDIRKASWNTYRKAELFLDRWLAKHPEFRTPEGCLEWWYRYRTEDL